MSKLIDGCVPAHTVCPFDKQCNSKESFCHHTGVTHAVPFSCAFARAYDMVDEIRANSNMGKVANMLCKAVPEATVEWEQCTRSRLVVVFDSHIDSDKFNPAMFAAEVREQLGIEVSLLHSSVSITKGSQSDDGTYVVKNAKLHAVTFTVQ